MPTWVSLDQHSWFAPRSHPPLVSLFITSCFMSCRTSLSEFAWPVCVCACACVLWPSCFYQLISNVSLVAGDPLITLMSLLLSGAIKHASGYLLENGRHKIPPWPHWITFRSRGCAESCAGQKLDKHYMCWSTFTVAGRHTLTDRQRVTICLLSKLAKRKAN